jgi:hypothetical protein
VAFWTGTNLTLTFAGHIGKYGVMAFCAMAAWALGKWGATGKAAWGVVAGTAAGAMFLEQGDVALFCAVLLAPIGLVEGLRAVRAAGDAEGGSGRGKWAAVWRYGRQFAGAALAAVCLAGGAAWATRGSGVTDGVEGQSAAAKWDFLTQWSQPPDESLEFIAPGWMGWKSGDEKGPYRGRTGRDAGWETSGRGFMNFRLETVYVGALPLAFAAMGLAEAWRRRKREAVWLVWAAAGVAALVLSFGKYTPLYRAVVALPGFGDIRNPNKFLHFFQLSWGMLAALGADAAFGMGAKARRRWTWAVWAAGALALAGAVNEWAGAGEAASKLAAAGWGAMGRVIQGNKEFALFWCAVSFGVAGGLLAGIQRWAGAGEGEGNDAGRRRVAAAALGWAAAAWVAGEAAWLVGPHFIEAMPKSYVAANALTERLQSERNEGRVAMVTQDGFYNLWLTYLFPYQGIPSVNVTQLPRPPADYSAFWGAVRDPVRQWELCAVSHVLAHGDVAERILADPGLARLLRLDWAYRARPAGDGGVAVEGIGGGDAAGRRLAGAEAVLAFRQPVARVQAAERWEEREDAEALRMLASPGFEPGKTVVLAPGSAEQAGLAGNEGVGGGAEISGLTVQSGGRYAFTAEVREGPAVVRVAENYHPAWRATVDGKAAPVLRCDHLFQAIAIPDAGRHEVVLEYSPSSGPVRLQALGLWMGALEGAWLAVGALAGRWRRG